MSSEKKQPSSEYEWYEWLPFLLAKRNLFAVEHDAVMYKVASILARERKSGRNAKRKIISLDVIKARKDITESEDTRVPPPPLSAGIIKDKGTTGVANLDALLTLHPRFTSVNITKITEINRTRALQNYSLRTLIRHDRSLLSLF